VKPGDFIIKKEGRSEGLIWKVVGVYLGGLGHQDIVGLIPFNRKDGCAHGLTIGEMLVPLELVDEFHYYQCGGTRL
jgi:hypothetical protein